MKHIFALLAALFLVTAAHAENPTPTPAAITATGTAPAPVPPAPASPAAPAEAIPAKKEEEETETTEESASGPGFIARVKAALAGNKNVAALHSQITALTRDRDKIAAENKTLAAQLDAMKTQRDAAIADMAQINAALDEQKNIVKATASEIASTVGQPLSALPAPESEDKTAPTKTMAEFKKLEAAEREEFFANGGKING